MQVVLGDLHGKKVLAALTGTSMVNAAMSTTQILERFNVRRIIMSGVSGGVDANPADVVVPGEWMQCGVRRPLLRGDRLALKLICLREARPETRG